MKSKELKAALTGYRITASEQHGYQLLDVELIVDHYSRPGCRFHWQANKDFKYYGGSLTLQGDNLDTLAALVKFIAGLKGLRYDREAPESLERLGNTPPAKLIAALDEAGIEECQYHRASAEFIARDNWPVKGSYKVIEPSARYPYLKHVFANSEAEAVKEGIRYVANSSSENNSWLDHRTVEFLASPQDWQPLPQLAPDPVVEAVA